LSRESRIPSRCRALEWRERVHINVMVFFPDSSRDFFAAESGHGPPFFFRKCAFTGLPVMVAVGRNLGCAEGLLPRPTRGRRVADVAVAGEVQNRARI
jgi:hypothetical protein